MDNEQIWAQLNRSSSMIQKNFNKTFKFLQKQDDKSLEIEENAQNFDENENFSEKDPLNASKNDTELASIQVQAFSQQNGEKSSKINEKSDYEDLEKFLEATENQQVSFSHFFFFKKKFIYNEININLSCSSMKSKKNYMGKAMILKVKVQI